jgi:predicted NACHT family NTPase
MVARSIRASAEGIQQANRALSKLGISKAILADRIDLARSTVNNFFDISKKVDRPNFYRICHELDLRWQDIVDSQYKYTDPELDSFVVELRDSISQYIMTNCGIMRILNMTQPVDVNNIYTDVNIFTKMSRNNNLEIDYFPNTREEFNRYCIQQTISEHKVPGLDATQRYSSLMILGKPGSGKTTFLKRLALLCLKCDSRLDFDGVPFFISLKKFSDETCHQSKINLISYIASSHHTPDSQYIDLSMLESILMVGRGMILLDGLDEVPDFDYQRVKNVIKHFLLAYPKNKIILTCRIAAREYIYEQLTEVEIADFNQDQIQTFVENWFNSQADSNNADSLSKASFRSNLFIEKIKDNKSIGELTSSPLLLTLLCLEFSDFGGFSKSRSELYERGINVMLSKWDASRDIVRSEIYYDLSPERKSYLLGFIAFKNFYNQNLFFKQNQLKDLISLYISNLFPNKTNQSLDLDAIGIIKSIEAQHGLLVERAQGIYSFSHLTFQEFFTANYIKSKNNLSTFEKLMHHINDKRWNDIFILTVESLSNAGNLLMLMKDKVDKILSDNIQLQDFLKQLYTATNTSEKSHKPVATRAFYFNLALNLSPDRTFDIDLDLTLTFAHYLTAYHVNLDMQISSYRNINLALSMVNSLNKHQDNSLIFIFYQNLNLTLHRIISYSDRDNGLQEKIINLRKELPVVPQFSNIEDQERWWAFNAKDYQDWWQRNGEEWSSKVRKIAMDHRDIGHDLRFSQEQIKLLEQYYNGNYLLVQCLMTECFASKEVRTYIEETLLLPVVEIDKIVRPEIIDEEI